MYSSLLALLSKAFVQTLTVLKPIADAAAGDNSLLIQSSVAGVQGPKRYQNISFACAGGYTCTGVNYFGLTVSVYDPATGALRSSASASFASVVKAAYEFGTVALNAPIDVQPGDLVQISIAKAGAGVSLSVGAARLSLASPPHVPEQGLLLSLPTQEKTKEEPS